MAKVRLTTRFIDTVKVDVRTDYHDTLVQGLTLRVAPTGTKTWNLLYTRDSDSAKQRVKLGRYPAMDLENARAKALKAMSGVSDVNQHPNGTPYRRPKSTPPLSCNG